MQKNNLKETLYEIIFESDTPTGKAFDIALLIIIIASVAVVILDSIEPESAKYSALLYSAEWVCTVIFTIEYILRLYCVRNRRKYAFSFFGIVDLLSCLPTYMSLFLPGAQSLLVIRAFRLMRIFRIFKLSHYLQESAFIMKALNASREKVLIFLCFVLIVVVSAGTLMYLIEGSQNGFSSIPRSMYWAIVTLTTVGYGDIAPQSPLGQFVASVLMILGYGVLAVPTGIVTAEMTKSMNSVQKSCEHCNTPCYQADAKFCASCGKPWN